MTAHTAMWQIYGQNHIIRQLDAAIRSDRLSHAYLLVGPPQVGKMALAIGMAQAVNCLAGRRQASRPLNRPATEPRESEQTGSLLSFDDPGPEAAQNRLLDGPERYGVANGDDVPCGQCAQCQRVRQGIHPDIRIIGVGTGDDDTANRRDIRIEQVRELESFLNLTPYEGACKVVVVDGAEQMNTAASNALLKTLEEPPDDSLLLLVTSNEDALLPTIRSRCSALYLKPVPKADLEQLLAREFDADPEPAERVARLSRGCFGHAVNALRDAQAQEERAADLNRLQQICEGGMDVRFDYAAEVATQFGRDREAAKDLLYLWLRWWRDLMLVKEGGDEYLYNADLATHLRLQATQLSTSDVVTFIKRINLTLEALDANANPRLTLEALMLGLPRVES